MPRKLLIAACLATFFSPLAYAAEYPLPDPQQEARAYAIFHDVRCTQCESNSLADSPADAAAELRDIIRQRVKLGDSDDEVKSYLTTHYGDKVKVWNRLKPAQMAMEFGPLVLFGGVLALVLLYMRKGSKGEVVK